MTKIGLMVTAVAAILSATAAFAADENINAVRDLPLGTARLTVDFGAALGPIKPMNAANDGPVRPRSDQKRSCWREFATLKVPFARTHDAATVYAYGGSHVGDVTAIFPDFDADENDPGNYDFTLTDRLLDQRGSRVRPCWWG